MRRVWKAPSRFPDLTGGRFVPRTVPSTPPPSAPQRRGCSRLPARRARHVVREQAPARRYLGTPCGTPQATQQVPALGYGHLHHLQPLQPPPRRAEPLARRATTSRRASPLPRRSPRRRPRLDAAVRRLTRELCVASNEALLDILAMSASDSTEKKRRPQTTHDVSSAARRERSAHLSSA